MVERAARVAAPAALALLVVLGAVQSRQPPALSAAVAVGVVVAGVVIAWRGLTGWPLVAALAVPAAGLVVVCQAQPANLGWFGMCVIAGWAALGAGVGPAVAAGAALIGTFLAQSFVISDFGWEAWIAGVIFTTMVCVFTRRQRELVERLRQAQAGLADRARAEERNRIAGEVHDVIGHALTVSLLHVSSARLALDDDPDEARASLTEAERLARESLDEVRATVGLLQATDTTDVIPMPSGADVPEVVESFRRAGTRVELDVCGDDLEALGATRGLAVYRIVQESLTNAARHGDGSPVTVRVDVGGDNTTVTVTSGGSPRPGATEGSGVVGMRERAEALGGRLLAGPGPGGWRIEAVLPS